MCFNSDAMIWYYENYMHTTLPHIFLDGGIPDETAHADSLLKVGGFPQGIEGQTTNPTLIIKNLLATQGQSTLLQKKEAYKKIVCAMATYTHGPISIQVIGNKDTPAETLLADAREKISWIPHGVIKFPCTHEGLKAAAVFCHEGPVNITLVFSQEQAAAVFAATKTAPFPVFVSPFVGRLDDTGEDGMDVIKNILEMYAICGNTHPKVLAASLRTIDHILYSIQLKSDIMTIPFNLLENWKSEQFRVPESSYVYPKKNLQSILYKDIPLDKSWESYDVMHPLTQRGVQKFWDDWNNLS